jgi:pSer/pThr/pTyr-binding forkhead associated (FHA) protein
MPPAPQRAPVSAELPSWAKATTPAAAGPASGSQAARFTLAVVEGTSPGQRFRLSNQGLAVGRERGTVLFPEDKSVSPTHATFRIRDNTLYVQDEGSLSGVYVCVRQPERLQVGGLFALGARVFRYCGPVLTPTSQPGKPIIHGAPIPGGATLYLVEELLVGARPGRASVTVGPTMTFGQAGTDFAFPPDAGLAPRHAELSPTPQGGALLRDLSGGDATFIRLGASERALQVGDKVRIGRQTLAVEAA